jgi:hypothetical protein
MQVEIFYCLDTGINDHIVGSLLLRTPLTSNLSKGSLIYCVLRKAMNPTLVKIFKF